MKTIAQAKLAQALGLVYLAIRLKWVISNTDLDKVNKLGLNNIKKDYKHTGQVKMQLD